MQIRRVTLANFRVYEELDLELQPALNFFQGENGQGKTALLEAIYCLATSRSFRTSHEIELMRWESPMAWVRGELESARGVARELAISWRMKGAEGRKPKLHKELAHQGQKVERLADFLGELPLALFVPEDLNLVQGSPSERRRYLDLILCKMYPAAVDCLGRFQKVLASRNMLLKRRPLPGSDELEPYDHLLAPLACELVERRRALLSRLVGFVASSHDRLAGLPSELGLVYRPQFEGSSEEFLEALANRRADELRRGTTLIGPHRDDFEIHIDGVDMRQYGSQGQCRTLALALRLAQASYFQEVGGEPAVVLLDDCFSELDGGRQERLLELLGGYSQVAVTSASPIALERAARANTHYFTVEGGRVTAL